MTRPDLFQSKSEFAVSLDGVPTVVHKGELVRAGHALLKGREHLFEPYEAKVRFEVEQMTAAPGKKRGE